MMSQLQKTAIYSFYDKKSNDDYPKASSSSILVKQYNKDVRIMRQNQEMLARFESVLRKAEYNDENSIQKLNEETFEYE